MKKFYFLFLLILLLKNSWAQKSMIVKNDSIKNYYKPAIVASTLILTSYVLYKSDLEKKLTANIRNKVGNDFEFPIDNYIQYAPIAEIYIANIFKVKSLNNWKQQTTNLMFANALNGIITISLKHLINKTRPNNAQFSYPSGHTSLSFTNATAVFYEYRNNSKVLAYSGFMFSSTTGAFRIINNKHWISDVLAGTGIGIISTSLVYYIKPLNNYKLLKTNKNIVCFPNISNQNIGMYFCYKF